jgi:hypothetical protein
VAGGGTSGDWRSIVTLWLGVRDDGGPISRMVGWSAVASDPCRREAECAAPPRGLLLDRLRGIIGRSTAGILAGVRG